MSSLALARLRQGQGRCTQQLLSLVQWHQQQSAAAAVGGAQRGVADQAAAVQFAKQRKGFENNLGELRKQWAKEREEREAAKAAAEAEARAAREAARAQRAQQDMEAKAQRLAEYTQRMAVEREQRLEAKAERLKRAGLRAEVLDVARSERRRQLLRQSTNWITPQTLDQRIKEALDNPVPLHAEG
ncbi:beta-mannosyltransferase 1-like [Chlorella sorokiniana]|uniref:Beta-mannosyltransferase 1-like n=1 Tax=Chlorella sorokiniana TaxID=3076 RepID=A0A2P6TGW0_CHLSO|nr:beta-mannosyltransferase 1-like [Chlorella sorokiniana]|eukprot:PRW33523.1 beta-mannosyltransferase 1-like [Chlorella sorokiniana]